MPSAHCSALRQRNGLTVVVEDILNLHLITLDAQDLVPAIHDVSLATDEHRIPVCEKNTLRLARLISKAKKLQRNRGGGGGRRRANRSLIRHDRLNRVRHRRRRRLSLKDVPTAAFVLCTLAVLQQVRTQRGVQRR